MSRLAARRAVIVVIVGGTLIRLWLAASTGLGFDESYMVGNARQLMLGYVDHPPLHVWLTWLAQTIAGSDAPIVVRTPFILLFAGSTWLMFRLTERLFDPAAGIWAVLALNLAPVFSLADATWVLPDGPLIFFLLAAANVLAGILFDETPAGRHLWQWLLAGIFAGCALLSKYSAVFFLAGVFLYLLGLPASRRHLATAGPWIGLAAAALVFLPALVWNARHGFAGFLFQGARFGDVSPQISGLLQSVGGQLLYLTPWLAVPFAVSLFRALRTGRQDARGWFLAVIAVVPIAFFTASAILSPSLPHWPMPGWLFAIPLFGRDAAALALGSPRFARGYMAATALIFAALIAAFAFQSTRGGLIPPALLAANPSADPTTDLIDWRALRADLAARGLIGPDLVVASPHWLYAGKASYALGPDVPVLCLCADQQQFAFRFDRNAFAGRDVVVVAPAFAAEGWRAAETYFDALEPVGPVTVSRGGAAVLVLDVRLGRNLQFH